MNDTFFLQQLGSVIFHNLPVNVTAPKMRVLMPPLIKKLRQLPDDLEVEMAAAAAVCDAYVARRVIEEFLRQRFGNESAD